MDLFRKLGWLGRWREKLGRKKGRRPALLEHRRFHLEGLEQRHLLSGGTIATVAGNGHAGYSGDGGPATSAQLSCWVSGVAMDNSGNLFIADFYNDVVRKVDHATGSITTVAGNGTWGYGGDGGAATSAELSGPRGVAVDAAGNLFIADSSNQVVREVSNGVISTVAGSRGSYLTDVAIDATGDLFVADAGNSVIREITGGMVRTVAGNGTQSYGGNGGLATSAGLDWPTGVALDTAGNLFIADSANNCIREVESAPRA